MRCALVIILGLAVAGVRADDGGSPAAQTKHLETPTVVQYPECPPAEECVAVYTDGGVNWLCTDDKAKRINCIIADCEKSRDVCLANQNSMGAGAAFIPIVGVTGIVVGFILGLLFVKHNGNSK